MFFCVLLTFFYFYVIILDAHDSKMKTLGTLTQRTLIVMVLNRSILPCNFVVEAVTHSLIPKAHESYCQKPEIRDRKKSALWQLCLYVCFSVCVVRCVTLCLLSKVFSCLSSFARLQLFWSLINNFNQSPVKYRSLMGS